MTEAAPDASKKAPKVYGVVLVSIPDFPPQDPGRWLVFRQYPEKLKAERKAKRLARRFPDYQWKGEGLTYAGINEIKRKPITLAELGVEIQFGASGVKVVRVDDARRKS